MRKRQNMEKRDTYFIYQNQENSFWTNFVSEHIRLTNPKNNDKHFGMFLTCPPKNEWKINRFGI